MANNAGDIVYDIRGDLSPLDADLAKIGPLAQKHARTVGIAMAAVGGAIVGGLGLAVKSAMDFQGAMAEVNTLGIENLKGLSDAVKDVSATFGLDLVDGANAAYQAISAGADEAETPLILAEAAKAATAGVTDLTTAIELGMGVQNAFGDSITSVTQVYDESFLAVKNGVTTFEELAASVGKLSPIFNAVGLSSGEMFASIAALTKGGIATAEAVTGMKGAITGIIKPTAEASELAEALGLEFNAAALEAKGLGGFLEDVRDKTGGNIETMSQLFGSVEGLAAVLSLTGAQAESFADILGQMENSTGATQEAFDRLVASDPGFAWRVLKAEIQVLVVEIGESLLPMLKRVVDAVSPVVKSIVAWVRAHPELTSKITILSAAIGGLMLVLGPLLIVLPGIATAAGLVATAVGAISLPVVAVVAAIAALVVAGVALIRNWDEIKAFASRAWTAIKDTTLRALKGLAFGIGFIMGKIWWAVTHPIEAMKEAWKGFVATIKWVKEQITKPIEFMINLFKALLMGTLNALKAVGRFLLSPFASGVQAGAQGGFARAVGGPASGLTLVGEHGPEALMLPQGSHIFNAADTASGAARGAGMGDVALTINVNATGSAANDPDLLSRVIARTLRSELQTLGKMATA